MDCQTHREGSLMAGAAAVLHGTADHAARFESKAATREPGLVKWG